ncbi:hypothetical protein PENSUB_7710 [Penicillium subrubescens]|uniref:Uncharacterized protein n=1 Tax=Penicillium subrubescens TaxID=1316194 RepID=A0A1Q5TKM7_9EURO|nr:hypothetical protein PENSUB_7710 [Penicillium subrubescens]
MWSKGPFKSRRPMGNPTSADKTDSTTSLHNTKTGQPTAPLPPAGNTYESKQYPDVSPAVSPELGPRVRDSGSSFCVSPIEDIGTDRGFPHQRTGSWGYGVAPAPAPARAVNTRPSPPQPSQSAPKTINFTPNSDEHPTRWDAYSGEPTTSNAGNAGQVEPRNTTFHKTSGSHATNFLHWGREQLQPKKKYEQARSRISSFSKNENRAPESRNRSSSRVQPLAEHSVNKDAGYAGSQPKNTHLGFVPTVVTTITAGDPKPLPERPATEHAYKLPRTQASYDKLNKEVDDLMMYGKPMSRFDAPITAVDNGSANGSPNDSPRASLNLVSKSTEDLSASIMSRRRPVPISMPTSKKPVRKPIPSEAAQEPTLANQSQPDDAPKDTLGRIEALEARRDELAKRRFNLETVIHELTRVIQPGSIAYDLAAKAEVKRSVQSIENEIAEIKREEHELGLKVTRAWRKLDERENHGDGSNLWVKRVTS